MAKDDINIADDDLKAAKKKRETERQKEWNRKNPEKARAISQRTYYKNREKILQKAREKRRKEHNPNIEKSRERQRIYRAKNPDKTREYSAKYAKLKDIENPNRHAERYAREKEKLLSASKKWRKNNKERASEIQQKSSSRRRASIKHSAENYTLAEIRDLRERSGKKCAFCGERGRMTIDHIVPIAKGGSNGIRNIQFLCRLCNSKKCDFDPIEFAQKNGRLL